MGFGRGGSVCRIQRSGALPAKGSASIRVSCRDIRHWPSLPQWGSLLYISFGASVLGFTFWNMAIDRIGPVRAGVLYYSVPLFSSVEAAFLLGESVTPPQICGGALIIGGILFSSFSSPRQRRN